MLLEVASPGRRASGSQSSKAEIGPSGELGWRQLDGLAGGPKLHAAVLEVRRRRRKAVVRKESADTQECVSCQQDRVWRWKETRAWKSWNLSGAQ